MCESGTALLANGFLPGHEIAVPPGAEPFFNLVGPVFLSLSIFFFGLWLIRARTVQTSGARLLVWVGSGCLAISYTGWGIESLQWSGVFSSGWASWYTLPVLVILAAVWWAARRRRDLPGPPRPWPEAATRCLSVGIAFYWYACLSTDLNWMHGNLYKRTILCMPWLWAGAFGAIVWSASLVEMTIERRRIRTACIQGGLGGLLVLWFVYMGMQMVFPTADLSRGIPESVRPMYHKVLLDRNLELFLRSLTIGSFAFAGAAFVVWRKQKSLTAAEERKEVVKPVQVELPNAPASTSSG